MAATHEQFMQKARAAFTAALKGDAGKEDAAIACALSEAYRDGMKRAADIARGGAGEYDFQAALAEGRDFDYGFHNGKNHAADSILARIILSEAGESE